MYRKVIIELVVNKDDCESVIQTFSSYLERFQEHTTVYRADIRDEKVETPENADVIAS